MNMTLPVDFERLPEFRCLVGLMKERVTRLRHGYGAPSGAADGERHMPDKWVEGMAVFIVMRLWVELAYAAQTTNRPGVLSDRAEKLLVGSLDPLFGEDCGIVALLRETGWLEEEATQDSTKVFRCKVFARDNAHLAGDFKSKEVRGAAGSALVRGRPRVEREVEQQSLLMPAETLLVVDETKATAGEPGGAPKMRPLTRDEILGCIRVIKTLDNCLRIGGRRTAEYTQGILADAWEVSRKYSEAQLVEFYQWLMVERDHPAVPERTEQLLSRFDAVFNARRRE